MKIKNRATLCTLQCPSDRFLHAGALKVTKCGIKLDHRFAFFFASRTTGRVRAACTPRWQPCVRAQATLHKKKHYLPVMKATNSDSKRCQVSVDVSFQSPSCFQRKKAHTFSSQAKGGRPHRHITSHIQPNAQVLIPAKFLDHRVPGVSWTTRTLMSSAGPSQNAGQPTIRR